MTILKLLGLLWASSLIFGIGFMLMDGFILDGKNKWPQVMGSLLLTLGLVCLAVLLFVLLFPLFILFFIVTLAQGFRVPTISASQHWSHKHYETH